jgi:hypothetical protein
MGKIARVAQTLGFMYATQASQCDPSTRYSLCCPAEPQRGDPTKPG